MFDIQHINRSISAGSAWAGFQFTIRGDGYFNMSAAAQHFRKDLSNFVRAKSTAEYIETLKELRALELPVFEVVPGNRYVSGRGTWGHPDLLIEFARWLDIGFAVFCDLLISDILHGNAELTVINPEKSKMLRFPTTDYADSVERLLRKLKQHPTPLSHQ